MHGWQMRCTWMRWLTTEAETDLTAAIGEACPDGVDLYFDNVGVKRWMRRWHIFEWRGVWRCAGGIFQVTAEAPLPSPQSRTVVGAARADAGVPGVPLS